MVKEDKNIKGHMAMFFAQMIFGGSAILGKMALASPQVKPADLTFWRMSGAMILMWIASIFMPRERVAKRDLMLLFFASLLGVVLNQTFFIKGLSLTSPINSALIVTMSPIVTMLLAALFLREPITIRKAGGVSLGVSGAVVLILGAQTANTGNDFLGDVFCFLSVLSFALYLTLFRGVIRRYRPVTLMKWMFLFATVCVAPFSYESVSPALIASLPTDILLESLYVVVFATFVSYFLVPIGQQNLRPTVVSMYANVQPLVVSVITVALSLSGFEWYKVAAGALIILGVYVTTTSKTRAEIEAMKASKA